jgi:hypothetical protein
MLYPAELRARHGYCRRSFDYSGNFPIDEDEASVADSAYSDHLRVALNILFRMISTDTGTIHACVGTNVNLSRDWQFLLGRFRPPALYFSCL